MTFPRTLKCSIDYKIQFNTNVTDKKRKSRDDSARQFLAGEPIESVRRTSEGNAAAFKAHTAIQSGSSSA